MPESRPGERPDPVAFWRTALSRVAERIAQERGVREDVDVYEAGAVLWVRFGDLRLRLGPDDDESELFEQIDEWVAFDRAAGPGGVVWSYPKGAVSVAVGRLATLQERV